MQGLLLEDTLRNCKFKRGECKPKLRRGILLLLYFKQERDTEFHEIKTGGNRYGIIRSAEFKKSIYDTFRGESRAGAFKCIFFSGERRVCSDYGESGSGKTTLLNILAMLDSPTSGEVLLNGKSSDSIRGGRDLSIPPGSSGDSYSRTSICWIHFHSGIISICRWCWRENTTRRWSGGWTRSQRAGD